jgi:biopolymer transport protein TolR
MVACGGAHPPIAPPGDVGSCTCAAGATLSRLAVSNKPDADLRMLEAVEMGRSVMAMDLGSKGSLKADINVTPLVDVMLVLLIIMMLIAPMVVHGGAVTPPEALNTAEKPETQGQTIVAIDARGGYYVNALPVVADDLVPRVRLALEDKRDKVVYLRGDKDAKYSAVMRAMDALRHAQIEDIALITERKQGPFPLTTAR